MKHDAIANNRASHWLPEHIKNGRVGDFLANDLHWALSRERYWGTPLGMWIKDTVKMETETPASMAEILAKNLQAFDHFADAKHKHPTLKAAKHARSRSTRCSAESTTPEIFSRSRRSDRAIRPGLV